MPVLARASPLKLSQTEPLHHTLQAVSDLCSEAVLQDDVPYASVLAASVHHHVLTPLRCRLYSSPTPSFTRKPRDSSYEDRELAHNVLTLLRSILRPPVTLSKAYDALLEAIRPLSSDATFFAVLQKIWEALVSVLRSHLFSWLVYGIVQDPLGQFFICDGESPVIIRDRLPSFISIQIAERILFAGNARRCSILLESTTDFGSHRSDERKAFDGLLADLVRAPLEIEVASMVWRDAAAHQLSAVLPFCKIRERLFLLRQYLLLGHATFWRKFFDDLRTRPLLLAGKELTTSAREQIDKALEQIMITTITEIGTNDLAAVSDEYLDPRLSLRVSESGDIYPFFSMNVAESQVLASRSSVYCDVFSIAFNIRRVACELRASFATLRWLDLSLCRASRGRARRQSTAGLVTMRELRRRMAHFVDGFEWYIQAEVLQPKFDNLLKMLDQPAETVNQRRQLAPTPRQASFFDMISSAHEWAMDKVHAQSFVGNDQINARLDAIFASCFGLCDLVRELSVKALVQNNFRETVEALDLSFSRNLGLLVRLLAHMQHGSVDSRIPALLVRINFNRHLHDQRYE